MKNKPWKVDQINGRIHVHCGKEEHEITMGKICYCAPTFLDSDPMIISHHCEHCEHVHESRKHVMCNHCYTMYIDDKKMAPLRECPECKYRQSASNL